ncbi:MAG: hypothetical protein U0269_29030 [Polyangiales bacterium]
MRTSLFALSLALVGCGASLPAAGAPPAALLAPTVVAWRSSAFVTSDSSRIADLALGGGVHCARSAAGRALCFGSYTPALANVVEDVPRPVIAVTAGGQHACALLDDRTVRCIGNNEIAQLGAAPSRGARSWTQPSITDVVAIAAGGQHTCALDAQRRVWCWGFGMYGAVGAPSQRERCIGSSDECFCSSTPTLIEGVSDVESVHAAGSTSCAVTRDRRVFCWGFNQTGQLGNHSTKPRATPVEALDARGLRMLALGSMHACALMSTGRVACWGSSLQHRLARATERWCTIPMLDGPPTPCDPFAAEIPGLDHVRAIASGDSTSCALRDDGTVWCWGVRYGHELAPHGWRAVGLHRVEAFDGASEVRVGGRVLCARGDGFDWRCVGGGFTSDRVTLDGSIAARPLTLAEVSR